MKMVSKFVLAAFAALTLATGAAQADNVHRQGGPGVVVSQDNVLSSQLAHDAQGR